MHEARDSTERRAVGVRLLEAQPDLAEGLSPEEEADARRHVVAVLEDVPAGTWEPGSRHALDPAFIGLLVIEGTLSRDVEIGGRRCSELLGPGGLLTPSDYGRGDGASVPTASASTVPVPA